MNKNLSFTLGALTLQLAAYYCIQNFYNGTHLLFFAACMIALVLVGSAILFIRAKSDQFIGRFMIATTVQMLSALSIIAAIVYLKIPDAFKQALLFLACFVAHLILQSVFLIKRAKTTSN